MNENNLKQLVSNGNSTWQIAKIVNLGQTTVRYWLKKYKLATKYTPNNRVYKCKCGETNPDKFYGKRKSTCGKCHNIYTIEQGRKKKQWAVELKGGECSICGYNKIMSCLCFHHLDPEQKDKNFSSMKGWSKAKIEKELENCICVCMNCHGEIHEELRLQEDEAGGA